MIVKPTKMPRFGQLEITVRGNRPEEVLFELNDEDLRKEGWKDSFVLLNHHPFGVHQKVGQLTTALRSGNAPSEDVLRKTIKEIIEHPEQIDQSPHAFKWQHLLKRELVEGTEGKKKTPMVFLREAKNMLLQAVNTHVFRLHSLKDSGFKIFKSNSVWLLPSEIKEADDLFLQMIKLGCVTRKK